MRKNYFLSAALIALTGFGLVGCSDNPDRITNVNEVVKELVDFGGYTFNDKNDNGIVDAGETLSGVIVTVNDPVMDKTYTATSDANGRFDFATALAEGSYSVSFTDAAATKDGAIVNSVEYYHAPFTIGLTQPGDGADGTPEQGAVTANFAMLSGPVMIGTNLGSFLAGGVTDLSKLTELTFTFNKPVTVINDPRLVDTTSGLQMVLTAEGASAAAIKSSILTSSRTTVAYTLPTLEANHAFSLDWNLTDYQAADNNAFGAAAPTVAAVTDAAGAGTLSAASNVAQVAAVAPQTRLDGNPGFFNTGTLNTVTVPTIDSVVVLAGQNPAGNAYSQVNSKYAIFAPQQKIPAAGRTPFVAANNVSLMARTYSIQLSNVKTTQEYTPIVSYDGGTVWYVAGATVQGTTAAANGSITMPTLDLSLLGAGAGELARPYYLVKGFYNTSTTDGENYTRLKVAVGIAGQFAAAGAIASGSPILSDRYNSTTANGIDANTERASDTWVNIFDGDLTDYKNRGFNRTTTTSLATTGNAINGIPAIAAAAYQGSSYPMPLVVASSSTKIATVGQRDTWWSIVQDSSILTDLVEVNGDFRITPVVAADVTAGGWLTASDTILSGIEEAASATVNANDIPNPALGTKALDYYVYFNEPMDSATIQTTTNWRAQAGTSGATAPSISKVVYSEAINTASGFEAFRAKVTLSAALVAGQKLELAAGALIDKNGNYPVLVDSTKPTSYITVYNN